MSHLLDKRDQFFRSTSAQLVFIAIISFIIYLPTINAPFVFDDHELIFGKPWVQDFSLLLEHWQEAGARFLTYVSFAFNYAVGGESPLGYHLFNMLLHIANGWAVFALTRVMTLTPHVTNRLNSEQKKILPFWTALLFIVHPLSTSAVNYIWQRAVLLTAIFYLLGVIFYLRARIERKPWLLGWTAACFILGIFCKGPIITLPITLLILELVLWPLTRKRIVTLICFTILILLVRANLYLWKDEWVVGTWAWTRWLNVTGSVITPQFTMTEIFVAVQYLRLFVFPWGQNFDYDIPLAVSFWEPRIVFSAVALMGILGAAWYAGRRNRFILVGIIWFVVCLFPSALISGRQPMEEYRMYLPCVGLALAITALVFQGPKSRVKEYIFAALMIVLAGLSVARNFVWQSPERFLQDTVNKSPQSAEACHLLGTFYLQQGRLDEAKAMLKNAVTLAPNAAESYNNLGLIQKNQGDRKGAQEYFETAIQLRPDLTGAYINLANLYLQDGKKDKAGKMFRKAIELEPQLRAKIPAEYLGN